MGSEKGRMFTNVKTIVCFVSSLINEGEAYAPMYLPGRHLLLITHNLKYAEVTNIQDGDRWSDVFNKNAITISFADAHRIGIDLRDGDVVCVFEPNEPDCDSCKYCYYDEDSRPCIHCTGIATNNYEPEEVDKEE